MATVGDLQRFSEEQLVDRFGKWGTRLWELARGIDEVVRTYREGPEREPTTAEILANVLFVLGDRPSRFLTGADDLVLNDLREG